MNTDVISISGAKCGDICNKLTSMGRTYKNITLVVGGNDCSSSMETNDIIENFALLVACAKSCATESVSVTSICPRPENPIVQDRINQVNIALKTASEKHDFKFIDTNDMFTLKDGSINDGYLLDDGVHLTYKGTEKLAQKLHVLNYKEAVIRQPKPKSYSQKVGKGALHPILQDMVTRRPLIHTFHILALPLNQEQIINQDAGIVGSLVMS